MTWSGAIYCAVVFFTAAYIVNLNVTPRIIGRKELEARFRPRDQVQFDQGGWMNSQFGDATRYGMANFLVAHRTLEGMSREDVISLLGKPDWKEPGSLTYRLAPQRRFPASSWMFPRTFWNWENWILVIDFDGDRVTSSEVTFS
jgi:hypothetical protein